MSGRIRIRDQKDFLAGLIYILLGGGLGLGALNYRMGDAARMGPGWFPFWVGMLLAAVGAVLVLRAMRPGTPPERMARFDLRTWFWILGAVVLFALLLEPLGLVLTLVVLILASSRASHEFTWRGALINTVVLLAISLGAFIYGVHLQIDLWPAFLH